MSDIPCNACDDLKTYAPDFVVNGVTDAVCAALQNDQGLNASNGRNNATDLQTAIDCLIGVLVSAIETYDVCDWQDFMKQFLSNNYELLSALICNEKGQWNQIHTINAFLDQICPTIDNIFKLIRGNKPKSHYGTWTQDFIDVATGQYIPSGSGYDPTPTLDKFVPNFRCEIREGAGCNATKRLGTYYIDYTWLDHHSPYIWAWGLSQALTDGDVIGYVPRSAVPETDMPLSKWKGVLSSTAIWDWGYMGDALFKVRTRGYTIIDGVAFNSDLASYGEDTLCVIAGPFIGGTAVGGLWGDITIQLRTYDI